MFFICFITNAFIQVPVVLKVIKLTTIQDTLNI